MAQLAPKNDEEAEAIRLRDEEHAEFYNDRVLTDEKGKPVTVEIKEFKMDSFGNIVKEKGKPVIVTAKKKVIEDLTTETTENVIGADGKVERVVTKVTGYKVVLND